MKKNIVKYTEDVAELLRQKDKYHLSDDVYEKRLREAKLRNGMLTQEDLGETSQKKSGSQKERTPEEERFIKEFFESKDFKNRFIYSVIAATLRRAKDEEIITGEEYIMYTVKARDKYLGNKF